MSEEMAIHDDSIYEMQVVTEKHKKKYTVSGVSRLGQSSTLSIFSKAENMAARCRKLNLPENTELLAGDVVCEGWGRECEYYHPAKLMSLGNSVGGKPPTVTSKPNDKPIYIIPVADMTPHEAIADVWYKNKNKKNPKDPDLLSYTKTMIVGVKELDFEFGEPDIKYHRFGMVNREQKICYEYHDKIYNVYEKISKENPPTPHKYSGNSKLFVHPIDYSSSKTYRVLIAWTEDAFAVPCLYKASYTAEGRFRKACLDLQRNSEIDWGDIPPKHRIYAFKCHAEAIGGDKAGYGLVPTEIVPLHEHIEPAMEAAKAAKKQHGLDVVNAMLEYTNDMLNFHKGIDLSGEECEPIRAHEVLPVISEERAILHYMRYKELIHAAKTSTEPRISIQTAHNQYIHYNARFWMDDTEYALWSNANSDDDMHVVYDSDADEEVF